MTTLPTYIYVLLTIMCSVGAQFFSKRGSQHLNTWQDFFNADIITCIFFYALSTASYLLVLKKVPLSTAYPLFSVSYVLVFLVGHFYFGETIGIYKAIGIFLLLTGIILIAFGEYKISHG